MIFNFFYKIKKKMNYLDDQDYFSNYNAEIVEMLVDHLGSCQQHVYIENLYTTKLYYTRIIQLLRDYSYKDIYFSMGVFITQYYEDQEEVERHMDIVRLVINESNINEMMRTVVVVMMNDQIIGGAANPLQNPLQNVEFIVKRYGSNSGISFFSDIKNKSRNSLFNLSI